VRDLSDLINKRDIPLVGEFAPLVIQKQYLQITIQGDKVIGVGLDINVVGTGSTGWKGFEEALRNVKGKTAARSNAVKTKQSEPE